MATQAAMRVYTITFREGANARVCRPPSAPLEPQLKTIIGEPGVWRGEGEGRQDHYDSLASFMVQLWLMFDWWLVEYDLERLPES
jgi:hypothetical protein